MKYYVTAHLVNFSNKCRPCLIVTSYVKESDSVVVTDSAGLAVRSLKREEGEGEGGEGEAEAEAEAEGEEEEEEEEHIEENKNKMEDSMTQQDHDRIKSSQEDL